MSGLLSSFRGFGVLEKTNECYVYVSTWLKYICYSANHPERRFFMACDDVLGRLTGEIIPQEGNVPRIGRLLIGKPQLRGKGLGGILVSMLIEKCKAEQETALELYVLTNNL